MIYKRFFNFLILPMWLNVLSVKYAGTPFNIAVNPAVDCKLTNAQAFFNKELRGSLENLL